MLILTAVIPVVLHFTIDVNAFDAAIYANIIGFILAMFIVIALMKEDLQAEKELYPLALEKILAWTLLGVVLAWISQIIAATIEIELFGVDPNSQNTEVIVELTRMNPLFMLIPAIIAPIIEELIFRKILFGTFYKKMNFIWAALLSSVIFGVFHMDLTHLLVYAAMGFVFAYLYVKTKRIIVPILVHMALNTITVTAQLFIDPEKLEQIQQNALLIFFGG